MFEVQIQLNPNEQTSGLTIAGAGLHHKYIFAQLHFHWGDRDEVGSEHTLHGHRYPLEIHLVHYNSKYENVTQALYSKDPEAIMVVGILAEV